MQAVDNGDSMEDLLQAVAERVQQRQAVRQQQQQQQSAKPAVKVRERGCVYVCGGGVGEVAHL